MLIFPNFKSINSPKDLKSGAYEAHCSVFSGKRLADRLTLIEYHKVGGANAVAADLIIESATSEAQFCDFLQTPDGMWRDSHGAKRDRLADLLPPEIRDYKHIETRVLDILEVQNNG